MKMKGNVPKAEIWDGGDLLPDSVIICILPLTPRFFEELLGLSP